MLFTKMGDVGHHPPREGPRASLHIFTRMDDRRIIKMKALVTVFVVFLFSCCLGATDVRHKYIGKSGCLSEIASPLNQYGIRLDRKQRTRLEAREFKNETILTLVQYSSDADKCGVVRDAIESQSSDRSFVWECVDKGHPSDVVIGTWSPKHPAISGPAIDAWRIDLRELRFVRLNTQVACNAENYAGTDEGEDLAVLARKRAAHRKSKDVPSQ
jgi:hypothetical protein